MKNRGIIKPLFFVHLWKSERRGCMAKEAVELIKRAEAEAVEIVKEATQGAEKILKDEKENAKKTSEELLEGFGISYQKAIQQAEKEAYEKTQKSLADANEEADRLKNSLMENKDKAIELILQKIISE